MKKVLTPKLSNSYSTGGGGFDFEHKVQASFLLCLVCTTYFPLLGQPVEQLVFQATQHGYETDDLVVISESGKLLCQMKASIAITNKNKEFKNVVLAAWHDFCNPQFNQQTDQIALITQNCSQAFNLQKLHELACDTLSESAFLSRIETTRSVSDKVRSVLSAIKDILLNAKISVSDKELWGFCKCYTQVCHHSCTWCH